MIDSMDSAEKMVPSSEEEENCDGGEKEEEENGNGGEKEEVENCDGGEKEDVENGDGGEKEEVENGDGGEKEEAENGDVGEKEEAPLAIDTCEKKISLPVLSEDKKNKGLNLNNEVVKMRKEVKRVRALIIRKLTRQISALKKKKGNEKELERNQRRADRLLEEIHAMKTLAPDLVTRTALQQNLSFEQVCKNPKCKISERAVARIATHPQFNRKIQDIKAGIEAFKEERKKSGKKREKKVPNEAAALPQRDGERRDDEDKSVEQEEPNDAGDIFLKDVDVDVPLRDDPAEVIEASKSTAPKHSDTKTIEINKPDSKIKKSIAKPEPKVVLRAEQEESEVESSDGETKPYFDDSTEERFYKQSSQSGESDSEDDFFLGKVSRFKKKKKKNTGAKKMPEGKETEPDEVEPRLKSKAPRLESVFCSTLSGSSADRLKGRSRGNEKRGGGRGINYTGQEETTGERSGAVYKKHPAAEGRGRGRGRGGFTRQTDRRDLSHHAPQQALHPSWEASKKRKEQEGQIVAFQGKKIKFDDDD